MDRQQYKKDWERRYREEHGTSYCNDLRDRDREAFNEYRRVYDSQRRLCECGCEVRLDGVPKHLKTEKHKVLLAKKPPSCDAVLTPSA